MWYKNAIGKEKIQFMFNNEFDIELFELYSISLEKNSELKCNLICKGIPKNHPKKWDKLEFNALILKIIFNEIIQMNISGTKIGFFCLPKINSSIDYSEITIKYGKFQLYCKSKFLTIDNITPYIDIRWD
ncbi:Imm50 family immunity protein [Snodgrassella sp. CS2]|uniref:Imm50 family immunity protein n=1 Tax=Snodgrassella sp. CS2 TaxID=3418953 RepID=UPI003D06317E